MGGVDSKGSRTPGAEGLCQERRGLQQARETGEGAAGWAGKRAPSFREGRGRTKGTPGAKSFGACCRAGAARSERRTLLPMCPGALIEHLLYAGLYSVSSLSQPLAGIAHATELISLVGDSGKVELPGPWWVLSWRDLMV